MTLNALEAGSGEPLVLLHGLGSSARVWLPVLDELGRRFHAIALDMPGFGESPPFADGRTPSVPALADAVADELTQREIGHARFVGNSMGGWVALELARRGRAAAVVALSPAGLGRGWERRWTSSSLKRSHRAARLLAPRAEGIMRWRLLRAPLNAQMQGRPGRLDRAEAAYAVRALARSQSFVAAEAWVDGNSWSGMDEVQCPVTVLWGTRDRLLMARQAERVHAHIPHAGVKRIPRVGHLPMSDDPETVAEEILRGLPC